MLTREEYLNQMQSYREELHKQNEDCQKTRDFIEDWFRTERKKLQDGYEERIRDLREEKRKLNHEAERKMHELKVQWAKEHPYDEVKVVND